MNTDLKPDRVVTRIPPSPTGHLHVGTARTALFNYLFAKRHGGHVVYRSEDTDRARSRPEFEVEIQDGLQWLGIRWENEMVRQSERSAIYTTYINQLIQTDKAYVSAEPSKADPEKTVEVVRLRNPNTTITFTDLVRGDITFDTTELGDFVIARSLNDALYHLTVVVDDAEMGITHVIRGEDHISNTPRQILIQEALGLQRPHYAHIPLILAPDRSKLSKRHGAVSLNEYQAMGILPEAMTNYLAFLGWNPGTDQELFSLDELIQSFSLEHVQKGGAVFDLEKLKWLNRQYLLRHPETTQIDYVRTALASQITHLPQYTDERLHRASPTILERAHTKLDIVQAAEAGEYTHYFETPEYTTELLRWKHDAEVVNVLPRLQKLLELLQNADFSTPDSIKQTIWNYADSIGRGGVLWPLRVALSGKERSADPFTLAYILQKEEVLARLQRACAKIEE